MKQKIKLPKLGRGRKLNTVSYTGFLVDLIIDTTRTPIALPYMRSFVSTELITEGVNPIYATVPCIAAEQALIIAPLVHYPFQALRSLIATLLNTYLGSIVHRQGAIRNSYLGAQLYVLYGLPASIFGYIRAVLFKNIGRPIPFMDAVLDGDLPTGLFTNELGISSTAFQKLIYTPRGQRPDQEFEGEPLDYTGTIPASVTITVRRKASAKLNRKKLR